MPKIDFAVGSFLVGTILALVLLALDKAEKLKGPVPLVLLAVAAMLTLPLALSVPIITNAQGASRGFRILAALCVVGFIYGVLAAWISVPSPTRPPEPPSTKPSPAPLPNLQFVRTGIEHINLDGVPRKIKTASEQAHAQVAVVAVFEAAYADAELIATIQFNDPANSHIDRACWLYEKTHVAKLNIGSRKELVIGYKQFNGFVCVENDYERDRETKIKLLRGKEITATVKILSLKRPVEAKQFHFKITVEPFGIQKLEDEST